MKKSKMRKVDGKIAIGIFELADLGFYVELEEKFREFIRKRIKNKFGSLKQFSLQTKIVPSSYLSSILTEGRYTKLSLWLKIRNALNIEVKKFKENILKIRARHAKFFLKPEQLPILSSPGLASLVGHGLGDGHLAEDRCFEYTNKEISLHNEVSRTIYRIFSADKFSERKCTGATLIRRYNVIVGNILYLAGVPRGNKIVQPFFIRSWILNGSVEIKKALIRALFDDEGTVKVSGREMLIKFSKNERYIDSLQKFMEQIKQLLEDLDIEATSIRKENIVIGKNGRTIQLVLGIHGYKNFIRFFEEIGFHHKQKQEKLEKMIKSYVSFQNRDGVTQKMLHESLSKPLTIRDLMNGLNMTYVAIYKGLRKLEKERLIKRMGRNKEQFIIWNKVQ